MTATPLDRRLNAYRADLADARLQGRVSAACFVAGSAARVAVPVAPLRSRPDAAVNLDTELLFGEPVLVFENRDGWTWMQSDVDGYVGYVPAACLAAPTGPATHRVASLATFVYPRADIKAPILMRLSYGARLDIVVQDERFARLTSGGYICSCHVAPIAHVETDFVSIAQRFVDVPYLWGGRSSLGLDCSGLVQAALHSHGLSCPRDSDMQEAVLGTPISRPATGARLERGDLVFWRGHVAIATGDGQLLHANAHHMAVAREDANVAIARIAAGGSAITSVRSLAGDALT